MHFCVSTARLYGRVPVPRNTSLNWFMPALVNSSVGSSQGTTLDDGTAVWPCFWTKKSRNCWRMSFALGMSGSQIKRTTEAQRTQRKDTPRGKREKEKGYHVMRAAQPSFLPYSPVFLCGSSLCVLCASVVRLLLLVSLLGGGVDLAQGDAVLPGH